MNASDIIKAKQNGIIYKSYYNSTSPSIYSSTTRSTLYVISSNTTNTSFGSCINTVYNYLPTQSTIPAITFMSYELANDANNGKYVCGGKSRSKMTWKANSTIQTQNIYAYSTYSTNSDSTILSNNSHAVRPFIFTNSLNQGTNFANSCNVCNNDCCNNCGSF